MSLFLSCIFCSTVKIRKNVLQKEIKDWTYKAYLLTEETSSWFPLIESLKITCAKSYMWFLNFYQTEGLRLFFAAFVTLSGTKIWFKSSHRSCSIKIVVPKFVWNILRKTRAFKVADLKSWRLLQDLSFAYTFKILLFFR